MSDVLGKDRELAERIREAREAVRMAIDEAREAGIQVSAFYNFRPGCDDAPIVTVLISRDGMVL